MGNDLSRLIKELTAANEAAKQGVEELEKKLSGEQGQGKSGQRQFDPQKIADWKKGKSIR